MRSGGKRLPPANFFESQKMKSGCYGYPKKFRPLSEWHWDSLGSILAIGVDSDTMLIIDFSRQPNTVVSKDGEIKGSKRKRRVSSLGIITEKMVLRTI